MELQLHSFGWQVLVALSSTVGLPVTMSAAATLAATSDDGNSVADTKSAVRADETGSRAAGVRNGNAQPCIAELPERYGIFGIHPVTLRSISFH